ncbi:N-acetylglucosamine-6-phosphate deacetylase [Pseudoprevotella muciniphila]|uniref:N-acetylglucosamine-6-phosphate deacetylase n=1 Tax=Pseudoprevotella muciniphila TaxID=2133944 RepID=A0A5P8E9M2_9BACT|nr:N-acetylglucosamine-6-phosphate deacetylase [Pseudoprevotella muciniphila]QFQ13652.1 N-acetylglucosamine-6-phosphate deacetylase [Pseudoprevotella muciniphila]
MMKQIFNGRILTPEGWLSGGSVIIEGNKILEVTNNDLPVEGAERIDAKGCDIVPGGIELHIHGGGGRDFMEGEEDAFRIAVDAHLKHGTTAIFPTLSSSSIPMINAAVEVCDKLMAEDNSPIMGLHLEGPYFNPAMAGAQMPEFITPPIPADYEPLLERTKCIKRWDAAPELPGTEEFGKFCVSHGCLPAIAHTKGSYEDAVRAFKAGFTHMTHFTNAMSSLHKVREFKHAGIVEAGYEVEGFTVEVIADGIHVPPPYLSMVYKMKGVEHTALITDALAVAASDATEAFDPRVIIEDGVCKLADRSALAGSIATMDRLVKTAIQQANIPDFDAYRMTSETPAKIMGIYDRKGSVQKGKDADITLYDNKQELKMVIQMGSIAMNNL